jgi:hypothetical protein
MTRPPTSPCFAPAERLGDYGSAADAVAAAERDLS